MEAMNVIPGKRPEDCPDRITDWAEKVLGSRYNRPVMDPRKLRKKAFRIIRGLHSKSIVGRFNREEGD